jgi:hypothetical protein
MVFLFARMSALRALFVILCGMCPLLASSAIAQVKSQDQRFSAFLFGLSSEDWGTLASFFVSPAIGLAAVYLLGADLLKLPFVSPDVPYRVPAKIIRNVALGLCLLCGGLISIWLTLRLYPGPGPAVDKFSEEFFRPPTEQERAWLEELRHKKILTAKVVIHEYDRLSDLRIFVNGFRLFGSHVDCAWRFQCNNQEVDASRDLDEFLKVASGHSFRYADYKALNSLPIERYFTDLIRAGLNYIDIFSNNSGVGKCKVALSIEFTTPIPPALSQHFNIKSDDLNTNPYRTTPESGTYRTCDQRRLAFEVQQ